MNSREQKIWDAILEISPVQFGVYDLVKHTMVYSSGLAERILGVDFDKLQELSHDYFKDLVIPEDYPAIEANLEKIANAKEDIVVETIYRAKAKDNNIIWVRTISKVLERDSSGTPVKILNSSQDITELKTLELKLDEEIKKLKSISSKKFYELKPQLNAVMVIVKLFKENHFSSEMDQKLWTYLSEAIAKMDGVLNEVLAEARNKK